MNYWAPHVTVAAVIEQAGKFLMVEERVAGQTVFNQPAGHLEPGESLIAAVIRETREETGHVFVPSALVGIYQYLSPETNEPFLRFAFCGRAQAMAPQPTLDADIIAAHWLDTDHLASGAVRLRSAMVLEAISDYRAARFASLELLHG